ncbi:MAG: MoaD/ThiS family protein [Pseudomonadota bacterium]
MKDFFSKIEDRLGMDLFKRDFKGLPDGVVILLNGEPVRIPSAGDVCVKDGDQISILRVIAGG